MRKHNNTKIETIYRGYQEGALIHAPLIPTITPTNITSPLRAGFNTNILNNFTPGEKVNAIIGDNNFIVSLSKQS